MKTSSQPARTLEEAFNRLRPEEPVSAGDPEGFYVPRPAGQGIEQLRRWLEMDQHPASKLLFSGHRGSGKSTELNRLVAGLSQRYFMVGYSIESVLDIQDISYIDVLFSMASQLLQAAKAGHVQVGDELVDALFNWSVETVKEWEEEAKGQASIGAKLDWFIHAGSTLEKSTLSRQRMRQQIEPKLTDLILHLNRAVAEVSDKVGRQALFVIDGIDKVNLPAARSIYLETSALLLPRAKVVYTIPYAFIFTPEFGQVRASFASANPFILPNIQVHRRDGAAFPPGGEFLKRVLLTRMDQSLLSPGSIGRLVEFSGGVVREAIGLAKDCCLRARDRVSEADVLAAATPVQNIFQTMLSMEDYQELRAVRQDPERHFTFSPAKERLIQNLSLLLYQDEEGHQWCDVHPLVLMLLEARRNEPTGRRGRTGPAGRSRQTV